LSLLGRLEDLSLTDIVQIVFLSRRTGVLEIIDSHGRHSVMFQQGLIVNATSPKNPDLGSFLLACGMVDAPTLETMKRAEDSGIPLGTAVIDMNVVTVDALSEAIRLHILDVITPLLASRDGEFNFILSDSLTPLDIEYEPQRIFKEGGIAPARILGEGEKLKPLKGLEDSMRAGKELLRGNAPVSSPPSGRLDLGLTEAPPTAAAEPLPFDPPVAGSTAAEFAAIEDEPFDLGLDAALDALSPATPAAPLPAVSAAPLAALVESIVDRPPVPEAPVTPFTPTEEPPQEIAPAAPPAAAARKGPPTEFRITERPPIQDKEKIVVLYQQDPLLRVSARRAFTRRGMTTTQYGSVDDARDEVVELLKKNRFFVTFLDLGPPSGGGVGEVLQLLAQIKRRNHRLPVVVIDRVADLRRRHDLLKSGADLYLTKPAEGHLQPGMVEEQLALFADELVLFAQRSFSEQIEAGGGDADASYNIAVQEKSERNSQVLMQLINELSDPNDISQVSQTILRLTGQYLERGAIFASAMVQFVGIGGFGPTGGAGDMNERAKGIKLGRNEPSVLKDVVDARKPHRGKLRRTDANVRLIGGLGTLMPSEVLVLPILNKDEVVGILYADNASNRAPIEEVSGLEIFLSQAGFALRNAMIANRGRYGLE
jgi:DNA-binding NarL/FixJ family response regulator